MMYVYFFLETLFLLLHFTNELIKQYFVRFISKNNIIHV